MHSRIAWGQDGPLLEITLPLPARLPGRGIVVRVRVGERTFYLVIDPTNDDTPGRAVRIVVPARER